MNITAQILVAAAILAGVGVIGRSVWWTFSKILRPLSNVVEDWRGEPDRPGVPGRPGVMVQLAELRGYLAAEHMARQAIERRLDAIEAQLKPNGGGSLRDAVDQALSELPKAGEQTSPERPR